MKALYTCVLLFLFCGVGAGAPEKRVAAKKKAALDQIIVPVVALEESSLWHSADFAWSRARELDAFELDPKRKGISIVIRFPAADVHVRQRVTNPEILKLRKEGRIDYRARNVTLTNVLVEIAKRSGYDLYTTSAGVIYCSPGKTPFPNAYAAKGDTWERLFKATRDGKNPNQPNKAQK